MPHNKEHLYNSAALRAKVFHEIKHEIHQIQKSKSGKIISKVAALPGEIAGRALQGIQTFTGWDYLKDIEVPAHKKILPTFGALLGCATALPALIGMAGPSSLLPPVACVASLAKVIHDATFTRQEYVERNLLRKDLISKKALQAKFKASSRFENLSVEQKEQVTFYTFGKKNIYVSLYELRQQFIDAKKLSLHNKESVVTWINHLIEGFSQNKTNVFDSHQLCKSIRRQFATPLRELKIQLKKYDSAIAAINIKDKKNRIHLSSDLRHTINRYRITQDRIYAQDLPLYIKEDIAKIIEGKDLEKIEVQSLYANIGNHFINITSKEQVAAQDMAFENKIIKYFNQEHDKIALTNYYQLPRTVFDFLQQMQLNLKDMSFPSKEEKHIILSHLKTIADSLFKTGTLLPSHVQLFQEIIEKSPVSPTANRNQLETFKIQLEDSITAFNTIFDEKINNEHVDKKRIKLINLRTSLGMHRESSTLQYAMGKHVQYDSPHIAFGDNKNNLIHQFKKAVRHTYLGKKATRTKQIIHEKINRKSQQMNDSMIALLLGDEELNAQVAMREAKKRKQAANEVIERKFKQNNESATRVLTKANKLAILEKTAPARWTSLKLSAAVLGLNTASAITVAVAVAPGAQPVLLATSALSAASAALTVVGIANDVSLALYRYNKENKLNLLNTDLKKGIAPGHKESKIKSKTQIKISVPSSSHVKEKIKMKENKIPILARMQIQHREKNLPLPILTCDSAPNKPLLFSYNKIKSQLSVQKITQKLIAEKSLLGICLKNVAKRLPRKSY